jgi:hypothetical protein
MEWVKPIDQVEADLRRQGVFILFLPDTNRLAFFGCKKTQADIDKLSESVRGRSKEMARFLTARVRAKGET